MRVLLLFALVTLFTFPAATFAQDRSDKNSVQGKPGSREEKIGCYGNDDEDRTPVGGEARALSIAFPHKVATASVRGVAVAIDSAIADGADLAYTIALKHGQANTGNGGVAMAPLYGKAVAGQCAVALIGSQGYAKAKKWSLAVAMDKGNEALPSIASADTGGVIVLGVCKDGKTSYRIGIIGDGSTVQVVGKLKANARYTLDANNNIVEVP